MRLLKLGVAIAVALAIGESVWAATFNSAAKANVLREYVTSDGLTCTNGVTSTSTPATGWSRKAANDGSGWNSEIQLLEGQSVSETFKLVGFRTVGSFMAQFDPYPARFLVEGSTDGINFSLLKELNATSTPAINYRVETTFDQPATVAYVRYTAYGPRRRAGHHRGGRDGVGRAHDCRDAQLLGLHDADRAVPRREAGRAVAPAASGGHVCRPLHAQLRGSQN